MSSDKSFLSETPRDGLCCLLSVLDAVMGFVLLRGQTHRKKVRSANFFGLKSGENDSSEVFGMDVLLLNRVSVLR